MKNYLLAFLHLVMIYYSLVCVFKHTKADKLYRVGFLILAVANIVFALIYIHRTIV